MPNIAVYITDRIPKARVNPVPDSSRLPADVKMDLYHFGEKIPAGTDVVVLISSHLGKNQKDSIVADAKLRGASVTYSSRASWSGVKEALQLAGVDVTVLRANEKGQAIAPAMPSMMGLFKEAMAKAECYDELAAEAEQTEKGYLEALEENEQLRKNVKALDRQVADLQKQIQEVVTLKERLREVHALSDHRGDVLLKIHERTAEIRELAADQEAPQIREVSRGG